MEEIKEFDCFEDGCGKCEVCEYLNFREMAENCAPSGSIIERNEKIERYLKRKDEEVSLAVSKERSRIVALIISTQTKYYGLDKKTKEETYSGAGTCRQCEKRRDSLEIGQVINLINTK